MLPFEKPDRVLFYHYYFRGITKPLIIEAANKRQSSQYILDHINQLPNREGIHVVNIKITSPIFGVTEKKEKVNGIEITYVWCGKKYDASGWMKKEDFINKNIYVNDQRD